MKTGISVKVTNTKSQNYGRQGVTVNVNSSRAMVQEFGTAKMFQESNRNLKECSHVTYAGAKVQSETLSSIELWLKQCIADCDGTIETYEPYSVTNEFAALKTQTAKHWKQIFVKRLKPNA